MKKIFDNVLALFFGLIFGAFTVLLILVKSTPYQMGYNAGWHDGKAAITRAIDSLAIINDNPPTP